MLFSFSFFFQITNLHIFNVGELFLDNEDNILNLPAPSQSRLTGGVENRKIWAKVNGAYRENQTAVQTRQNATRSAESANGKFVFHSEPLTGYYLKFKRKKKTKLNGLICSLLTRQNGGKCL